MFHKNLKKINKKLKKVLHIDKMYGKITDEKLIFFV